MANSKFNVCRLKVCDALRDGRLTKPLVAWCTGTCARVFPYEVQFGHAGALAHGNSETAAAKNAALRAAGAIVPANFEVRLSNNC